MTRRHPKRRLTGKHFAAIPVEVLTSDACRTLPHWARTNLIALAAEYRGNNNGNLSLTWTTAHAYGVNSKWQLVDGLALLLERGLIQRTRQGGKRPLGPSLYAVTWQPINDLAGKIESGPTTAASNAWANWTSPDSSALREDQRKINHQHLRGTSSAPKKDHRQPVSAPRKVQTARFIGTSGGPPSRVWYEGQPLTAPPVPSAGYGLNGHGIVAPGTLAESATTGIEVLSPHRGVAL
jgi:hypothetical protein